ncbi:hypothetical protein ACJW31_04G170900 [Castanea mollissima]
MMMNSNISESRESTELEEQEAGGRYHDDEGNGLKSNNEIELSRIRLMRSFVETQDPSSKVVDDLMIRRFLRARDLNVEKASVLFLKYLKWRQTFVPNGSISPSELPHEIAQNKMFIQGFDKTGRPIAVVFGARHFQTKVGIEEFKRYVVYGLDKLCSRMPPGQEKFVFIADLEGWGYSNSDIRAYLGALSILQAVSNSMVMAGLLPRKIREGFYHPCVLHIYDSMENCIPLYRQKYQEEDIICREQKFKINFA